MVIRILIKVSLSSARNDSARRDRIDHWGFKTLLESILEENLILGNTALAQQYTTVTGDIVFTLAVTPKDIIDILRLRFLSYVENDYIDPDAFPDGFEYDRFDPYAVMIMAKHQITGNLHGCARLVTDQHGFPLEDVVNIDDFRSPDKSLAEMSRMISFPPGQPEVNSGILRLTHKYAKEQGLTHIVGLSNEDKEHYFERIGFFAIRPKRLVVYGNKNGHQPDGKFYPNVLDVKNWNIL